MEEEDEWLEIENINKLINFSRKLIYNNFDEKTAQMTDDDFFDKVDSFTESEQQELDIVLPFKESKIIIKEFLKKRKNKQTQEIRIFMKESDYGEYLDRLNHRMVSNLVMEMVKKGVLDSAFDDTMNDFVFWVKNDADNDKTN